MAHLQEPFYLVSSTAAPLSPPLSPTLFGPTRAPIEIDGTMSPPNPTETGTSPLASPVLGDDSTVCDSNSGSSTTSSSSSPQSVSSDYFGSFGGPYKPAHRTNSVSSTATSVASEPVDAEKESEVVVPVLAPPLRSLATETVVTTRVAPPPPLRPVATETVVTTLAAPPPLSKIRNLTVRDPMRTHFPKPEGELSLDELLARPPAKWSLGHYVKNARETQPPREEKGEARRKAFEAAKQELLAFTADIERLRR